MATDTHKYADRIEAEARHSALEEFGRDERRPLVLLLSALVLAVLFFTIGLLFGRWTAQPGISSSHGAAVAPAASGAETPAQPAASPITNSAGETSSDQARRFTLLVATFDAEEKAQALIKSLQQAGYADVRLSHKGGKKAGYSVLAGHYTQAEADVEAEHMRSANDARLKGAKVIEEK